MARNVSSAEWLRPDDELAGGRISKGDAVVIFYESANWDGTVFTDPDRFDILRIRIRMSASGAGRRR
jgi:cytochrome P450